MDEKSIAGAEAANLDWYGHCDVCVSIYKLRGSWGMRMVLDHSEVLTVCKLHSC